MNKEVKLILTKLKIVSETEERGMYLCDKEHSKILLDYITNLEQENKRLKEIAHKMHLWIFLHSGDEQKVYDELELTDEENAILGYSGQFRIGGDEE